jgi:hypothetical protein
MREFSVGGDPVNVLGEQLGVAGKKETTSSTAKVYRQPPGGCDQVSEPFSREVRVNGGSHSQRASHFR